MQSYELVGAGKSGRFPTYIGWFSPLGFGSFRHAVDVRLGSNFIM
jgi:hypothetical protein